MRISTKGRYALRVMIDLVQNSQDNFTKLQDIAERQNLSIKYLEGILGTLVKAKLLTGNRGKAGGYKLNCDPKTCSVYDILKTTETSVVPVSCLDEKAGKCPRMAECETYPVWEELDKIIQGYLTSVTLDQFATTQGAKNGKNKGPSNCGL